MGFASRFGCQPGYTRPQPLPRPRPAPLPPATLPPARQPPAASQVRPSTGDAGELATQSIPEPPAEDSDEAKKQRLAAELARLAKELAEERLANHRLTAEPAPFNSATQIIPDSIPPSADYSAAAALLPAPAAAAQQPPQNTPSAPAGQSAAVTRPTGIGAWTIADWLITGLSVGAGGVGGVGGIWWIARGAVGLWRRWRAPSRTPAAPQTVIVETPPPPQVVRSEREYVPYQAPNGRLAALELALKEYVRRNPGSVSTIETIEGWAKQFESGKAS